MAQTCETGDGDEWLAHTDSDERKVVSATQ